MSSTAGSIRGPNLWVPPKKRKLPETAYFADGIRVIDFVLAYQPEAGDEKNKALKAQLRQTFEAEMVRRGLELEYEGVEMSEDQKTAFIKIHATWEALGRQAELENLQMPMQVSDLGKAKSWTNTMLDGLCGFRGNFFRLSPEFAPDDTEFFTDAFDRDREDEFLIGDRDTFFSEAKRIYLTWGVITNIQIALDLGNRPFSLKKKLDLRRKKKEGGESEDEEAPSRNSNIQLLLRQGVYAAAFPIHDGECEDDEDNNYEGVPVDEWPLRKYLFECWARPRNWTKMQPLDTIRDYYGEKVGIYFAWLGFYTKMLFIPAILGVITFIIGIYQAFSNAPAVDEICDLNNPIGNFTICRPCPTTTCVFSQLSAACLMMRINRIFDNGSGAYFAVFVALWAVTFQAMWERYRNEICTKWDLAEHEFSGEQVRPEYELEVTSTRINPVTNELEVYLPPYSKAGRIMISIVTALVFVITVIGLIVTVMVYKIASPLYWKGLMDGTFLEDGPLQPTLVAIITASCVQGLFIVIMNQIYGRIAWKLTVMEKPRTVTAFEKSYVFKTFVFQFVNFYGAIMYLAFIRGQFMSAPQEQSRFRDRCPPSGCMLDVTIMLITVMTGKQLLNNFMEIGLPTLLNYLRRKRSHKKKEDQEGLAEENKYTRWEKDFDLAPIEAVPLFGDYLEMVIQYGFITMFVTAFPLGPVFALANNIAEIRVDAFKDLTQFQRFIPVRANDIGPWGRILRIVTKIAILTNAVIVAFTTDFVDKYIFNSVYLGTPDPRGGTYDSLNQFKLSPFNTLDWCEGKGNPDNLVTKFGENCTVMRDGYETCWYRDYRHTGGDYEPTQVWWNVMVAKLAFIFLFEHFCVLAQGLIQYLIPPVPDHVTIRIKRENFIQRQAFMKSELLKEE